MNSFHDDNYSEIGLFTFYREQAEYEEKLQIELEAKVEKARQSKEEAERKKNKTEFLQQFHPKQEKGKKQKESKTLKSISSTPLVRFIKKTKLNTKKKTNEDRMANVNAKEEETTKYIPEKESNDFEEQPCDKIERNSVPIKVPTKVPLQSKKEFFSKLNSRQNSEKEILIPKEFNSFDVLELKDISNGILSLRKRQQEGLLFGKIQKDRLEAVFGNKRLPRLNHDESVFTRHDLSIKRRERIPNQYDPKDILKNNKKYEINLPKPVHRNQTNNSQSCIMSEIREKENTHCYIHHYETIDNSFNF